MSQRSQFIVDAFLAACGRKTNRNALLSNGFLQRNKIHAALQQGLTPIHPRFEWVRKQARTFLELVLVAVRDYEKQNPSAGDRASMLDAYDIMEMTKGHVEGIVRAGVLDPDGVELLPYDEVRPEITVSKNTEEGTEEEDEDEQEG